MHSALEGLLRDSFQGDDYTIRLWEAEAKLESLGYVRCADGRWREKLTEDAAREMASMRAAAGAARW